MRLSQMVFTAALMLGMTGAVAAPMPVEKAARLFGSMPMLQGVSISPDGKQIAMIVPGEAGGAALFIVGEDGKPKQITKPGDNSSRLLGCGWSANDRLVCSQYGVIGVEGQLLAFTRTLALDSSGHNVALLGRTGMGSALRISQSDGWIIDWMSGADGNVLMMRDFVPEYSTGTRLANTMDGMGVERVDTRTLRATRVEQPRANASTYISDGQGRVRIMAMRGAASDTGMLTGQTVYFYRPAEGGYWRQLCTDDAHGNGTRAIAVDPTRNVAYAVRKLDGRDAIYRLSLDGKATAELAYADPKVDIDDVVKVGRSGRVIGVTYVTDQRRTVFFDPVYQKLAAALARAVPTLPLISFVDASADENYIVLRAGSDVDPGRFYLLDRATRRMEPIMSERPALEAETLAAMKTVSLPGPDGVAIPAYLTLPPGSDGRNLPAIVMPHGGPASRDEWGFDWLVQFFAARGYAVLQPEFRGSSGWGDSWFQNNGFQSWRTAIGDVTAAGKWLVGQGIADPARLAIVGWSYGGYAALQSGVVDPGLFKAVVAIAPVTDLEMLKAESTNYTNNRLVRDYIGTGPLLREGSPLRRVAEIRAPVLLFHGDMDLNVRIGESQAMAASLRRAGKPVELVSYKGLDHQLADSRTRIDMLTRTDAFLADALAKNGGGPSRNAAAKP